MLIYPGVEVSDVADPNMVSWGFRSPAGEFCLELVIPRIVDVQFMVSGAFRPIREHTPFGKRQPGGGNPISQI